MNGLNRLAGTERGTTRRTILAGVTTAAIGLAAGCLSDDEPEPVADPVSIDSEQSCDNCKMAIGNQPGPVGQLHYEDPTTVFDDDDDRPAQFCSTLCTYTFAFENEETAAPEVTYLTDYSAVDYEVNESTGDDGEGDGNYVLSSHFDADSFTPATALELVVDSDVEGAMGGSIVAFGDGDDATVFSDEYGGEHYEHEDVTQELVMSLM